MKRSELAAATWAESLEQGTLRHIRAGEGAFKRAYVRLFGIFDPDFRQRPVEFEECIRETFQELVLRAKIELT